LLAYNPKITVFWVSKFSFETFLKIFS